MYRASSTKTIRQPRGRSDDRASERKGEAGGRRKESGASGSQGFLIQNVLNMGSGIRVFRFLTHTTTTQLLASTSCAPRHLLSVADHPAQSLLLQRAAIIGLAVDFYALSTCRRRDDLSIPGTIGIPGCCVAGIRPIRPSCSVYQKIVVLLPPVGPTGVVYFPSNGVFDGSTPLSHYLDALHRPARSPSPSASCPSFLT